MRRVWVSLCGMPYGSWDRRTERKSKSVREFLLLRFGEEEAGGEADHVDDEADDRGGPGELLGRRAGQEADERRGGERGRRADHPAANVGREAFACPAQ